MWRLGEGHLAGAELNAATAIGVVAPCHAVWVHGELTQRQGGAVWGNTRGSVVDLGWCVTHGRLGGIGTGVRMLP